MPKALIVDDENKNLYLLQVLLKTNGFELDSASNGAEALELARRNRPDIIISDILMPVMDGFSLCRACKGDERLRDIPFVFYTATYTDPKDEELALNLGADRFLIKPTEPDLFLGLIKETLEEAKIGKTAPRHGSIDEIRYIKDYNDALVRKLEQKLAQLETAKHSLELDIEARKITEEALREARNNYATLVDNASVGVYQTNLQGHILFANQDLARMWHFDAPSDLVDSGILARFKNPLDFARLEELLKRDRVVKNFETEMLTRDGEAHTVLLNASLEERTITGIVNDISERKRAEIHLRQQTSRAEALVHTASRLNSNLGLEEVLNAICEETVHALDAPCVAIYLADKSGRSLSIAAEYGLPSVFRDHRINMLLASFGFSGAQSSGTPLVLPDVRAVANFPDADLYLSHDIRTIVSTQLRYQDVIFGSLRVYTTGEPRIFREDELAFLEGLNNQAAQAINNASLFQRVERHLKYIEALHTIDVAIANSVDLRLALKVLVIEVTRQLNVDAAAVLLYQPATQTLVFAAGQGFTTSLAQNATVRLGEGLAGRAALERKQVRVANTTENQKELARADLFYAESFTTYLGTPLIAKGQIIGVLEVFHRASLNPDQEWSNFLDTLAGQAAIAIDSLQSFESLQEANKQLVMAYDDTIEGWSRAMDLRDKETEGHTRRVTQLTLQLAQEMGIGAEEQVHMRRGALLHDMGKLGIPDGILLKADKLSEEEWQIMRRHPQHAYDMLSSIEYLRPALDIPYCHHEKWDGSGYPRRLKGEEIPLAARVFAVVDVWDALTSDRPYRNAWLRQAVVNYIREQSGTHFDPRIAEIFLRLQAT